MDAVVEALEIHDAESLRVKVGGRVLFCWQWVVVVVVVDMWCGRDELGGESLKSGLWLGEEGGRRRGAQPRSVWRGNSKASKL